MRYVMRKRSFSRWSVPASSVLAPRRCATRTKLGSASTASTVARGVTTCRPGTLASRALTVSSHPEAPELAVGRAREVPEGEHRELASRRTATRSVVAGPKEQVCRERERRCRGDGRRDPPGPAAPDGGDAAATREPGERGLELESRVAGVPQAPAGVLLQAAGEKLPDALRRARRQRVPVGLLVEDRGQDVRNRLAREGPATRQHLVQNAAERPDVGAPVGLLAARLLGAHELGRPDDLARASKSSRTTVGEREMSPASGMSIALARPKSRTLTLPSGVILMLAGFRSRWRTPFSCANSSASAIWAPMRRASAIASGPRVEPLRERLALDELHHDVPDRAVLLGAVDRRDRRVVDGREHPGLALEARHAAGIRGGVVGQDLDRDVPAELPVARAVHHAHSPRAEHVEDLVGPEAETGLERHPDLGGFYVPARRMNT